MDTTALLYSEENQPLGNEQPWARDVAQLVEQFPSMGQSPGFDPHHHVQVGMFVHACDSSTWEMEAGGSGIEGHL